MTPSRKFKFFRPSTWRKKEEAKEALDTPDPGEASLVPPMESLVPAYKRQVYPELPVIQEEGVLILGEHPFPSDQSEAKELAQPFTTFPDNRAIVKTQVHIDAVPTLCAHLNRQRVSEGNPEFTQDEWRKQEAELMTDFVATDRRGGRMRIRVESLAEESYKRAQAAKELLESVGVPPEKISFVWGTFVANQTDLFTEMKKEGELWKFAPQPMSDEQIRQFVAQSQVTLGTENRYYHLDSGGRLLTPTNFSAIAQSIDDPVEFSARLAEVVEYNKRRNKAGVTELSLFPLAAREQANLISRINSFRKRVNRTRSSGRWRTSKKRISRSFNKLAEYFESHVLSLYRADNFDDIEWCSRMRATLQGFEMPSEGLWGMNPDFYSHCHWLPGARIEEGNPKFHVPDADSLAHDQFRAHQIIKSIHSQHPDLEYINVARVIDERSPLSTLKDRERYVALYKRASSQPEETLMIFNFKHPPDSCANEFVSTPQGIRAKTSLGEQEQPQAVQVTGVQAQELSECNIKWIFDRRKALQTLGLEVDEYTLLPGTDLWSRPFHKFCRSTINVPRHMYGEPGFFTDLMAEKARHAAVNVVTGSPVFDQGERLIGPNPKDVSLTMAEITGSFRNISGQVSPNELDVIAIRMVRDMIKAKIHGIRGARNARNFFIHTFEKKLDQLKGEYGGRKDEWEGLFESEQKAINPAWDMKTAWPKTLDRIRTCDTKTLGKVLLEKTDDLYDRVSSYIESASDETDMKRRGEEMLELLRVQYGNFPRAVEQLDELMRKKSAQN